MALGFWKFRRETRNVAIFQTTTEFTNPWVIIYVMLHPKPWLELRSSLFRKKYQRQKKPFAITQAVIVKRGENRNSKSYYTFVRGTLYLENKLIIFYIEFLEEP